MRILVVTNTLRSGGGGKYISQLANVLVELNHEVSLLTYDLIEKRDYKLSTEVKLFSLGVKYEDSNIILVKIFRRLNWIWRIRSYRRKNSEDVLIAATSDVIIDTILAGTRNPNLIAIELGNPFHQKIIRKSIYFSVLKAYKKIVVLSDDLTFELGKYKSKTTTIPGYISNNQRLIYNASSNIIVSSGKLIKSKRFDILIQAMNIVNKSRTDIILKIYGVGPEHDNLQTLIFDLGLDNHVKLEGYTFDIYNALNEAALFVYSSESEGFCFAVLEAVEASLPVISTKFKYGFKQLIQNDSNGLVINLGDFRAMAINILSVMEDEALRLKMSSNSKEIKSKFYREGFIRNWDQLLNQLRI